MGSRGREGGHAQCKQRGGGAGVKGGVRPQGGARGGGRRAGAACEGPRGGTHARGGAARLASECGAARRLCEAALLVERPVLLVNHARQPEVTDLDIARAAEEDVGGLEVAVEDVGGVEVLERHEQLLRDPLHVRDRDGLRRGDQLAQVEVNVVEADPQVGEGALGRRVQAVSDPARGAGTR